MKKLLLLLLFPFAAFAQSVTSPVDSIWNIVDTTMQFQSATVTPLDGSSGTPTPIGPLTVPVGFTALQSSISIAIPPSTSPYNLVGLRLSTVIVGTGWTMTALDPSGKPLPFQLDKQLPALAVPAGLGVNVVYTAPLSGLGSVTASVVPDTAPPSAPSNLLATAASTSVINLAWGASADNVGVSSYMVERCAAPGCIFTQIASGNAPGFSDTGLSASQLYSYRVRASDTALNLSAYSNIASATTLSPPPPPLPIPPPPPPVVTPPASGGVPVVVASANKPGACVSVSAKTPAGKCTFTQLTLTDGSVFTLRADGIPMRNGVATLTVHEFAADVIYVSTQNYLWLFSYSYGYRWWKDVTPEPTATAIGVWTYAGHPPLGPEF